MKILAFAYACEPRKGSEPGAGWGWARLLAHLGDTWIITRENNREAIEAELSSTPEAGSLHFVYVDLAAQARRWKRGQRGIHLYYMLWQRAALKRARELHTREGFDLVWHLTLANIWMGSLAPLVGPRFIRTSRRSDQSPWGWASRSGSRNHLRTSPGPGSDRWPLREPSSQVAWRRADVILVQENPETRNWLPRRYRSKAPVFPNALLSIRGWPGEGIDDRPQRPSSLVGWSLEGRGDRDQGDRRDRSLASRRGGRRI